MDAFQGAVLRHNEWIIAQPDCAGGLASFNGVLVALKNMLAEATGVRQDHLPAENVS